MEQKEVMFCQAIANVSLLAELNNNNFLNSDYYDKMIWSCSESNKRNIKNILDSFGMGNAAMLQMFMYALLVMPKEVLGEDYCEDRFNNEVKKYIFQFESTYVREEEPKYYHHIRNSIAHSKCKYFTKAGENYIAFEDCIPQNPSRHCKITMETLNVGKLMEFLMKELMIILNKKINTESKE